MEVIIGGLLVAIVILLGIVWFVSTDAALMGVKYSKQRHENARAAKILSVLNDRGGDLKRGMDALQATNDALTRLLSETQQQLSAVPFLQEQVKHLQLVVVDSMKASNDRILAFADLRVQAQVRGQELYVGERVAAGREEINYKPNPRRRVPFKDGFSDEPTAEAPVDGISNFASVEQEKLPRTGESNVIEPENPARRNSPYDNEVAQAAATIGVDLDALMERLDRVVEPFPSDLTQG